MGIAPEPLTRSDLYLDIPFEPGQPVLEDVVEKPSYLDGDQGSESEHQYVFDGALPPGS